MTEPDLESIYREAQSALKTRDYTRASELLREILQVDENYKDTSRLLARVVKLRRRRWYNHPLLWIALGGAVIVAAGFFLAPRLRGLNSIQPTATLAAANSPTATFPPTVTATATATLLPTPTPVPLAWKRISLGQDFERDTVTAFATDKKDPDVIYAAMKNAGVYKTIDGGLSWRPAHRGLANTQVESLLIDSQNPHILYAGTMGGVFKTEDGGENWSRIGDGTYLLMDMQDNPHLYARDENGIYETTDQGNTWNTVYVLKKDCPDTISSWAIHPTDGNMLFIGGGEMCAGVYQSNDGGGKWVLIGMEDKPNLDTLAIGLDEQGNFSVYTDSLFVSHDGGAKWSNTGVGNGCAILASDPDIPATIYCASDKLYVMRKKGDTWQLIPGTQSKFYSAIHIDHPNGVERLITGATNVSQDIPYFGIFISEDGGNSWAERNNGLGSARAELTIGPLDNARIYLATYYAGSGAKISCGLYRSHDNGINWAQIISTGYPPSWCGPAFGAENVFFLMVSGRLQSSQNGGETWWWEHITNIDKKTGRTFDNTLAYALPSYYRDGLYLEGSQSVSANPYFEGFVYDVSNVIYYSTDAGLSWQLSAGSQGSWDARLFYTDQSKMIFAIGSYHQSYSTDNGKTWQNCGEDVTASRSDSRLALDLQGSRLYLATPGQGVMISTDNCQSWKASNEGLSNLFANTLVIDPNDPNKIYAGTDGGAYVSFDGGQTWGQVNDGLLGATVVYSIVVDKDSNVYAATPYGIFKLESR